MMSTTYSSIPLSKQTTSKEKKSYYIWYIVVVFILCAICYYLAFGNAGVLKLPVVGYLMQDWLTTEIQIEYEFNDIVNFEASTNTQLTPDSPAWISFHNALITSAGYDPSKLQNDESVSVAFVAYDASDASETDEYTIDYDTNQPRNGNPNGGFGGKVGSKRIAGLSCFSKYKLKTGSSRRPYYSVDCSPTTKFQNPSRVGCSSFHTGNNYARYGENTNNGCTSYASETLENIGINARCCQPTPATQFDVVQMSVSEYTSDNGPNFDSKCLNNGCGSNTDAVLTGCTSQQGDLDNSRGVVFNGVQLEENECKSQRSDGGYLSVDAICVNVDTHGFDLQCDTVESSTSTESTSGKYSSEIQCGAGTVMFDCNVYVDGQMDQCAVSQLITAQTQNTYGSYYYSSGRKIKVYCVAEGDSPYVRAQASCCKLVQN